MEYNVSLMNVVPVACYPVLKMKCVLQYFQKRLKIKAPNLYEDIISKSRRARLGEDRQQLLPIVTGSYQRNLNFISFS